MISTIAGFTSAADHAISSEGGTGCDQASMVGCPSSRMWQDDASRAGYIARYFALDWSFGAELWPSTGMVLAVSNSYNAGGTLFANGALTPEGIAYNTAYKWLVGSTPSTNPFCAPSPNPNTGKNTIYACSMTVNGSPALLVWDSEFGPKGPYGAPYANCTTSPNPRSAATQRITCPPDSTVGTTLIILWMESEIPSATDASRSAQYPSCSYPRTSASLSCGRYDGSRLSGWIGKIVVASILSRVFCETGCGAVAHRTSIKGKFSLRILGEQ
jgi:hypothetical protein